MTHNSTGMDFKKCAVQRFRSCQLGMDAARNELVDPLVDERLLPHIYAPDNPGDPLRRPPSPRRALEPRNESLLECHTANPMARPTIGYCVETLTRPGYMRTNLDPPRQHGPRLMSETERLSWLSDQRRQQYTGQSTSIDTQLVARHWPEHVGLLNNRFYADFYSSIFPREFPMLERITPDLHSATRTVLDAPTPPTVRDLPLGVLSLDADRPTTEAYEMGSEIATIIQEVLYYLSLRDMQETQVAADRLMRCSQAMLHLLTYAPHLRHPPRCEVLVRSYLVDVAADKHSVLERWCQKQEVREGRDGDPTQQSQARLAPWPVSLPAAGPSSLDPATPAPLTLKQQHITAVEGIVTTVNLDCRLDLKMITLHARNVEYNPNVSTLSYS
ncbi:hypothetical protein K523DRAFT_354964 [Schizophyllum commune Tattone D]|nr:hypothetical protein K523DRAFT_354964 [Schizophyllum commune Tattone D]